eukprot:1969989-Lingulodinium_polyedra.AAC.1
MAREASSPVAGVAEAGRRNMSDIKDGSVVGSVLCSSPTTQSDVVKVSTVLLSVFCAQRQR